MARYTGTVDAPHGAEEVWRYLADLRSVVEWDPSVEDVRLLDGEPRTGSARYELKVRFRGKTVTVPYRTAVVDPPHRVVFEAETDQVVIRDEATIESAGPGRCTVTWDAELRLRGIRRALDPLLRPVFNKIGRDAERGLFQRLARPELAAEGRPAA
jgi:carbon monoxide dehydrogenase subunit G